jgi:hypothetical protein
MLLALTTAAVIIGGLALAIGIVLRTPEFIMVIMSAGRVISVVLKLVGVYGFSYAFLGPVKLTVPAYLVHLWLPLFLVAGTITGALNVFFQAVGWAQWFIKRGNSHPLDAIGMVASVVVFVGAAAWQGITYLVF